MAVITFYTSCEDQTGNTTSALALATYLGIVQNKKILYISTAFNDNTIRSAMWEKKAIRRSGLFGPNTTKDAVNDNGIEGLDRIIRSNRISSSIVTDYTRVALTGRLEFLLGYKGEIKQYEEIQNQYSQIVAISAQYYDNVIVDIDRGLEEKNKMEILNISDIVIAMTTQKLENINKLAESIENGNILKDTNTLITIGNYDYNSKYNAKNISRSYLKRKKIINTIPHNTLLFEAEQEGQVIDLFIKLLGLKGNDENTFFLDEIKRLSTSIEDTYMIIQKMRR